MAFYYSRSQGYRVSEWYLSWQDHAVHMLLRPLFKMMLIFVYSPSDYPFQPPDLMLLTVNERLYMSPEPGLTFFQPSGRFEVSKKICLRFSIYRVFHIARIYHFS